jgi:hemoglobin-like flavoprotein
MDLDLNALETSFDLVAPRGDELMDEFARHTAYGAQPEHYPILGDALIATMATIAGAAWQPEHESAWREAFAVVAGTMLEGAEAEMLEAAV